MSRRSEYGVINKYNNLYNSVEIDANIKIIYVSITGDIKSIYYESDTERKRVETRKLMIEFTDKNDDIRMRILKRTPIIFNNGILTRDNTIVLHCNGFGVDIPVVKLESPNFNIADIKILEINRENQGIATEATSSNRYSIDTIMLEKVNYVALATTSAQAYEAFRWLCIPEVEKNVFKLSGKLLYNVVAFGRHSEDKSINQLTNLLNCYCGIQIREEVSTVTMNLSYEEIVKDKFNAIVTIDNTRVDKLVNWENKIKLSGLFENYRFNESKHICYGCSYEAEIPTMPPVLVLELFKTSKTLRKIAVPKTVEYLSYPKSIPNKIDIRKAHNLHVIKSIYSIDVSPLFRKDIIKFIDDDTKESTFADVLKLDLSRFIIEDSFETNDIWWVQYLKKKGTYIDIIKYNPLNFLDKSAYDLLYNIPVELHADNTDEVEQFIGRVPW